MSQFSEVIKNLPNKPGVYRFYSLDNSVLYIGKAKNLKNRVASYFQEGRPKNQRLTLMITQIDRIEYTVVDSESESLILEANLIHNLQPKYNILLKDDKNYLNVRITNDQIPGIFLVRRKYDNRSRYFGPYTKRSGIFDTLRTLRTIFPYCQERTLQKRPCSYYGIKQCEGVCVGIEKKEDYLAKLDQIAKVLEGKTDEVEIFLKSKIKQAVEAENFELAGLWRDRLRTMTNTIADQKVILPQPQNLDLVTLITQETAEGLQIGSIFIQNIRDGKMINVNNFLLSGTEEDYTDLGSQSSDSFTFLQRFLSSYYNYQDSSAPVLVQCFYLVDGVEMT